MDAPLTDLTDTLLRPSAGDRDALEALVPAVYDDLCRMPEGSSAASGRTTCLHLEYRQPHPGTHMPID